MINTLKQTIESLKGRIADAYSAVSNKGGTLPSTQDSANLPAAIASIPSGGGSNFWTGHIDEAGLRAIGWPDSDLEWFRERVDWMEEQDDAYKVPQELIDAYNQYIIDNGAIDAAFVTTNKANWWFRYCPYIPNPNYGMCQNAIYMYAAPSNLYYARLDHIVMSCSRLRYIPKITRDIAPNNTSRCFQGIGAFVIDLEIPHATATGDTMFYASTIYMLKVKVLSSDVDINFFRYNPSGVKILDIDVPRLLGTTYNAGLTSSCVSCRVKGLVSDFNLNQSFITKDDLLYIINGEATEEGESVALKLVAAMYNLYSTDADILAALANHPRVTLISA